MPRELRFPQDWDPHLNPDTVIEVQLLTLPAGAHLLRFEHMHGEQFELLCWWLLQKDHRLVGCQRLGPKGNTSQEGIDLFAYDRLQPDRLQVFECKCWAKSTAASLTDAVDRFLAGNWASTAASFTLILAQRGTGGLDQCWDQARRKLHARGIDGELWTAEHLTEKLQTAPDVLSKFFPGPDLHQQFGNAWMQKVGFTEQLLKAHADQRPAVAQLAREFLSQGLIPRTNLEKRHVSDHTWSLSQPWLDVSALLPTASQYPGSAIISLKLPDTAGVTVILDQHWLLTHFLGNSGEPLLPRVRPFFQGALPGEGDTQIVDLKNCRFFLPEEALHAMAGVADELSAAYLQAIRRLELDWDAQHFPVVQWVGTRVAMCTVETWVWETLLAFANAHDSDDGDSEWHVFHKAHNRLMPHGQEGYMGMFFGAKIPGLCGDEEIALLWDPQTAHLDAYSGKGWSCLVAYHWITHELLPAVGHWRIRRLGWRRWLSPRRLKRQIGAFWTSAAAFRDIRSVPLLTDEGHPSQGPLETLRTLQSFYNGSGHCQRAHFDAPHLSALYEVMLWLLKGGRGHPAYMESKLGIATPCATHADLETAVSQLIEQGQFVSDTIVIEHVMRAMLEALGDDDHWLSADVRDRTLQVLMPYMQFHDQQLLIDRHTLYLENARH